MRLTDSKILISAVFGMASALTITVTESAVLSPNPVEGVTVTQTVLQYLHVPSDEFVMDLSGGEDVHDLESSAEFGYSHEYFESHLNKDRSASEGTVEALSPYHLAPYYSGETSPQERRKFYYNYSESIVSTAPGSATLPGRLSSNVSITGGLSAQTTSPDHSTTTLELSYTALLEDIPTSNPTTTLISVPVPVHLVHEDYSDNPEFSFGVHVDLEDFDVDPIELQLEKGQEVDIKEPIPDLRPGEYMDSPRNKLSNHQPVSDAVQVVQEPSKGNDQQSKSNSSFDANVTEVLSPGSKGKQILEPNDKGFKLSSGNNSFFEQTPGVSITMRMKKMRSKPNPDPKAKSIPGFGSPYSAVSKKKKNIKNPFRTSSGSTIIGVSYGLMAVFSCIMLASLV